MPFSHFTLAFTLHALFNTFPSAFAQNIDFNSSNYDKCPQKFVQYAPDARVNSTGRTEFLFSKAGDNLDKTAWYLSATFNETQRNSNNIVKNWFQGWLSAPKDAIGNACIYKFNGVNASTRGTRMIGCDGVLSPACITALGNFTADGDSRCPDFKATDETLKHCGNGTIGTVFSNGTTWTDKPLNVSNDTCTIPSPQHVSVPSGYRSIPLFGYEPYGSDSNFSSFEWYDIHVQQPIPWVIAATLKPYRWSDEIRRDTQVVCVTPNSVVDGSRKPTLQFKPREEDNPSTSTNPNKPTNTNDSQASHWHAQAYLAITVAVLNCLMILV